jgi:hypothetical protein
MKDSENEETALDTILDRVIESEVPKEVEERMQHRIDDFKDRLDVFEERGAKWLGSGSHLWTVWNKLMGQLESHRKENTLMNMAIGSCDKGRNQSKKQVFGIKSWKLALAAAALTVLGFALSLSSSIRPVPSAYALEQTIEANRGLRSIHLKYEPSTYGSIEELWAEFDEDGDVVRMRYNFPDTEDGPKDVIWQEGKAEVWFKSRKGTSVLREEHILNTMKLPLDYFNPKLIAEDLYQSKATSKIQIDVQRSSRKGEPIILTVNEAVRRVYKVDPETKLLLERESYELKDGQYKLLGRTVYMDYNQPISPNVFSFDLPADAIRVDQTTQDVGMARGDLTDEEVAVRSVREFFEALVAKDYTKAGRICSGIPAATLREYLGERKNVVRIISIGEPTPPRDPRQGGFRVSCEVEIENDGVRSVWNPDVGVRPVYGQPDRWNIFDL